MGVTKMIFSQQIKNNAVYYCFLKGVVYIIQTIPQSYGHYVLLSAKYIIAVLPFVYLAIMSVVSLLAQYSIGAWLVYNKIEKKQNEVDELKAQLEIESNERVILQRSAELLMECIKTLTKKLDTEIVSRRTHQCETEKDKQLQLKKIECIETKVERLKSNLKKGIFGMDKALQGIREHTANLGQYGQGDMQQ